MKQKELNPEFYELSRSALDVIRAIDDEFPNLKRHDLKTYIYTIARYQVEKGGHKLCVVVVTDMPAHRKKEIEGMLKGMQFQVPTLVQVRWDDQSDFLDAIFQVGKNPGKDVSSGVDK